MATGTILLGSLLSAAAAQAAPDQVVIEPGRIVLDSFMGLGIQWDPHEYPPTDADWALILRRLDHCRPAFFRVMWSAYYCTGFAPDGRPQYVWEQGDAAAEQLLRPLLRILDYCQAHDITVMLGEWSWPRRQGITGPDDPRWARLIADEVAWLRNQRHYTCIRLYNMFNEPNGNWMWQVNYDAWAAGIRHLRQALDAKGLQAVKVVGPDNSGSWEWLDRAAAGLRDCFGGWEMHWYARDREVLDGDIERLLTSKREMLLRVDPQAAEKPRYLGESGLIDGKTNGDQQPRTRTFEYGVLMADYVAQVARAGWGGACAWDLDDALHSVGPHKDPPDDKTLKIWGFWNSRGAAMGHPEEMQLRPWYTTWSLMTRLFPPGSQTLGVTEPARPGCRTWAGRLKRGDRWDLSVMLVNDQDAARSVHLTLPEARGTTSLRQYNYFADDRPTDADGFPLPKATLPGVDLARGLDVTLPSRGVVFLTTLETGSGAFFSTKAP